MLSDPPRDIRIEKESKEKYTSLAKRFSKDDKEIFLLAMKLGFFYGARVKIKGKKQALAQLSTLPEDEIRNMMIIAFSDFGDVSKIFDGKEVVKTCEEYANGGIKHLYRLFVEEGGQKDDLRVIEDVLDELKTRVRSGY